MSNNREKQGLHKSVINWYPGHMAKARKEMKELMPLVDIIFEVIDGRMPISSKIPDLDEIVKNKKRILIVTKWDLCDQEKTKKLLKRYEKDYEMIIPTDALHQLKKNEILQCVRKIQSKVNLERKEKGLKERNARILVVGVPNVGKSTLINQFVGKKVAKTADRPGVTTVNSWIRIHKEVELLDSPGILWPKIENSEVALNLASLSSIKEEILDVESLSEYVLDKMLSLYPENLKNRYQLSSMKKEDIRIEIAKKRGFLSKDLEYDNEKVSKTILKDLKEGYFGKITFD